MLAEVAVRPKMTFFYFILHNSLRSSLVFQKYIFLYTVNYCVDNFYWTILLH